MKNILRTLLPVLALLGGTHVDAQPFPSKPITIAVPYSAGGSTDREVRLLSTIASKELGQAVIVDNRTGAAGTLAATAVASTARPDGYTLAVAPVNLFRLPHMQKTTWDPLRDFTYIAGLSGYILGIAVRADSEFKSWADIVKYAKANPGKLAYSSAGVGSSQHLGMVEIEKQLGISLNHIPYKGGPESSRALLAGEITMSADPLAVFTLMGDRVRILMVWEPERNAAFASVPTARELGVNLVSQSPYGLVGPAGMPADVVQKLHKAFDKALGDPQHVALLEMLLQTSWRRTPEEYAAYARDALAAERKSIERAGLLMK